MFFELQAPQVIGLQKDHYKVKVLLMHLATFDYVSYNHLPCLSNAYESLLRGSSSRAGSTGSVTLSHIINCDFLEACAVSRRILLRHDDRVGHFGVRSTSHRSFSYLYEIPQVLYYPHTIHNSFM